MAPQFIPGGVLFTVPVPVPARMTLKAGEELKVAVTFWFELSVTVQVGLTPAQPPPDQPAKYEFAGVVSVSVTRVPAAKLALQVVPQLIPEGLLLTVPTAVPARLTLKTSAPCVGLKVAVTCLLALRVTEQVGVVPVQAPDHPAKNELLIGAAVSVTWVPLAKLALQA